MLTTPRHLGFTLVEAMITVAVGAILASIAAPSMTKWLSNAKVRTSAEMLQNGIRLAQAEALSRGQQTVLALTTATPAWNATPATNGGNWAVHVQPLLNSADAAATASNATHPFVQGSTFATQNGVTVTGPALLCFNSLGRVITSTSTSIPNAGSSACTATFPVVYTMCSTGADRCYSVSVSLGGKVRMCDASKTLSATNPDGC